MLTMALPRNTVIVTATLRSHGPAGGSEKSTSMTIPDGSVTGPPPKPLWDWSGEQARSVTGEAVGCAEASVRHAEPLQPTVSPRSSGPPAPARPPYRLGSPVRSSNDAVQPSRACSGRDTKLGSTPWPDHTFPFHA